MSKGEKSLIEEETVPDSSSDPGSNPSDPEHVGIILDGNRRFAKRLMKKPWQGHKWGAEKVEKVLRWCAELGVKELTLYAFSMQNFDRPEKEFNYLMDLFKETFEKTRKKDEIFEKDVRIKFIGRTHLFPDEVKEQMEKLEEATEENETYTVNFAMAYGGREELVDAVKSIGRRVEEGELDSSSIGKEVISDSLYLKSEPDLIIRTGGDRRTSNFLIWQSHYSEWFFLEKFWPEFEKEDFERCIEEFKKRERRFGR